MGGGGQDFQGGPPIFSQASKRGRSGFREVGRGGGAPNFLQENLKIECTID